MIVSLLVLVWYGAKCFGFGWSCFFDLIRLILPGQKLHTGTRTVPGTVWYGTKQWVGHSISVLDRFDSVDLLRGQKLHTGTVRNLDGTRSRCE
jgi:hypothetical protein